MSEKGQNAKFRGDRRMSAFAPKADISRFMSTRPSTTESESRSHAWVESAIWRDSRLSMSEAEMGLQRSDDSESRFTGYVEGRVSVLGHADRAGPLRDYCVGLMMPCERKSVEPMAAVTAPERTAAQHQSLLHFVGNAAWADGKG